MITYLPMDPSRNMMEDKINEILEHLNKPSRIEIKWKVEGKEPTKAHDSDAGFDIYSSEEIEIPAGQTVKVKTGLSYYISPGYFLKIMDRSSVASKGIKTVGGVCDNGYRGEIQVCLTNTSQHHYIVHNGDKIAQMVVLPSYSVEWSIVQELPKSERGEKGFGSSGK